MIETSNLQLIPWERAQREAYLRGKGELATMLNVKVPESWPHFPEAYAQMAAATHNDRAGSEWHTYFFVHRQEGVLVGSDEFYGEPDEANTVEIGYEIQLNTGIVVLARKRCEA